MPQGGEVAGIEDALVYGCRGFEGWLVFVVTVVIQKEENASR